MKGANFLDNNPGLNEGIVHRDAALSHKLVALRGKG